MKIKKGGKAEKLFLFLAIIAAVFLILFGPLIELIFGSFDKFKSKLSKK